MQVLIEFRVPAGVISHDQFSGLATSMAALGTAEESDVASGKSTWVAWFDAAGDGRLVRARIAAAALLLGLSRADIDLQQIGDDWETAWQKHWRAQPVGEHLWLRPSFCPPPGDERIDIVLDPGMAFGTGTHATTQLCLRAIEKICLRRVPASMLDMGAGSGVLAIAAAKLGVANVLAVDNDPLAVDACRRNAEMNNVRVDSRLDDRPPAEHFDLVVANILAGPLIAMASGLAGCVRRDLLLAGLQAGQAAEVRRRFEAEGLVSVGEDHAGDWVALRLRA